MDIITKSLNIIDNSENNLKNVLFHNELPIYIKSNERIQDYRKYLQNKKIISLNKSDNAIMIYKKL